MGIKDGIVVVNWQATAAIVERMEKARDENPRGDLYKTLPNEKLLAMLRQNVDELELALKYGNDVEDKCADVANYAGFILHNYLLRHEQSVAGDGAKGDG